MDRACSIGLWLESLPHIPKVLLEESKKRKLTTEATYSQQLASPPASHQDDDNRMTSTPNKRPRKNDDGPNTQANVDTTPRPGARSGPSSFASFSQSMSDTSSIASGTGTSSPKKQMMTLRLSQSGVEIKALDVDTPPEAAQDLVSTMVEIGHGHDILPHALESAIKAQLQERGLNLHKWRFSFQPNTQIDGKPGRVPAWEEVEKIRRKASECQEFNHEEASWNNQVHLRLLENIFEENLGEQCDCFNAMTCTTARPHREFRPVSSPVKMIDICVYASLDQDTALSEAVARFSQTTPTQTVNHTDFAPISARPLVLSIETKRPGVHGDTAQLQIGIWHAAQWSFLEWAVRQKLGRAKPQNKTQQDELEAKKRMILSSLGFIPGVIVQGHRWLLVLSTYEDGKTKLWTDHQFGTTQSCLEIYAAVAGIRQLTTWARDVYLPWFELNVLN